MLSVALMIPFVAFAQQFKPVQVNPFGMLKSDTISLQAFQMADMNKDSLPDLLYTSDSEFFTFTYLVINKGSVGQPDFANSPAVDFEDDNNGYGEGTLLLFGSRMVDFDNDTDIDHLYNYYTDDPSFPAPYTVELNQPELVPTENFDFFFYAETDLTSYGIPSIPLFTYENFEYKDITGDGLPDILASRVNENTFQQEFVYYERLGLESFAPPVINPFDLQSTNGYFGQPCMLDVDNDGDQDLFLLDAISGNWLFYKNAGTPQIPLFLLPVINPYNLTAVPPIGATAFAIDVNQDGREDLMAANFENFYYYEFNSNVSSPALPLSAGVRVFPTLIQDKCYVEVNGEEKIEKIFVYNLSGCVTATLEGMQEINFQAFAAGVYEVTIYLENGSRFSQKVVKAVR